MIAFQNQKHRGKFSRPCYTVLTGNPEIEKKDLMKNMEPKKLVSQLFTDIQMKAPRAVFLGVRREGARLSFGLNTTNRVEYWINLQWPGGQLVTDSGHGCGDFTLISNQSRPGGPLQLALFGPSKESEPLLLYDGTTDDRPPVHGEILILATAPNGQDHAVLSAAFDGRGQGSYLSGNTVEAGKHLKLLHDLHRSGGPNSIPEGVAEDYEAYEGYETGPFSPFQ